MNVLSVGFINWDILLKTPAIPQEDMSSEITSECKKPGGSATNTALTLESLGVNSALAGPIGTDKAATQIKDTLDKQNISYYVKENKHTSKIYSLITDNTDPRYLYTQDSIGQFSTDIVPQEKWDDLTHLHITSFDKSISNKFVKKATQHNLSISFNPNHKFAQNKFPYIVEHSDLIILNDTEYETLSKRYDISTLRHNTTIVITHGSNGCSAYKNDTKATHSGFEADIIDTVGAGDSFIGGFLTQWLTNTELYTCLKYGNAVAATSIETRGSPNEINKNTLHCYL